MSPEKYDQLWKDLIAKEINKYLIKYKGEYKFTADEAKLKKAIYYIYEREYKPQFKNTCMAEKNKNDSEHLDEALPIDGGSEIKIDRHKVAALLYLAIVSNDECPFVKSIKSKGTNNIFNIAACHEIAYNVSLSCIHSFIIKTPNTQHKNNFLKNKGFYNAPYLICEEYDSFRDSIIPRMVWASKVGYKSSSKLVSVNANMLANIFYFLELYSASAEP
ncbi:MAG: hypothetical protein FWF67_02260 [Fibromonadales bacterium]|nr:hypothetical protein [Fibromonadales bacterium]